MPKYKKIKGSQYDDQIRVYDGERYKVFALAGNDTISINNNGDPKTKAFGGDGEDYLSITGAFGGILYGEQGDDRLRDDEKIASLIGGPGDDVLESRSRSWRSTAKARLLGEEGNDVFNLNTGNTKRYVVDGGPGDDLIGITGNASSGQGSQSIRNWKIDGGNGDDTFFLNQIPSDRKCTIIGGEGFDRLYINRRFESAAVETSLNALTFAYWLVDGIAQETRISLIGFEEVIFSSDEVPYKWSRRQNQNGNYALWTENTGFVLD
jgi:Ca2+-binding RTX toxin-like protein